MPTEREQVVALLKRLKENEIPLLKNSSDEDLLDQAIEALSKEGDLSEEEKQGIIQDALDFCDENEGMFRDYNIERKPRAAANYARLASCNKAIKFAMEGNLSETQFCVEDALEGLATE